MNNLFESTLLSPLRKVIAARMSAAKQSIPHYRLSTDVMLDALLQARARDNIAHSGPRVSVNDYIVKACASALVVHKEMNVQLMDEVVHRYLHAHISIIVAVEGGLSCPVIRAADLKSVREISAEINALTERAVAGKLRMDELTGGTFSISNLGPNGVDQFDAVINAPQCAILAVGRARRAMIVPDQGAPRVGMVMTCTLSVDHRLIDGLLAAKFLSSIKRYLETPAELALQSS